MERAYASKILQLTTWPQGDGTSDQPGLYVLKGDASRGDIEAVHLEPGVDFPAEITAVTDYFDLVIYHFNDLHGHLVRSSPRGKASVLARFGAEIARARRSAAGEDRRAVLTMSCGDDSGGSILEELIYTEEGFLTPQPCYHLFGRMGVDAVGLGNHDFDHGLPALKAAVQSAEFPVLAANLDTRGEDYPGISSAAVLVRKGLRIGLIGLVTRAETRLDPDLGEITNPIPVARNLTEVLRPFCDVLIILSHLGYSLHGARVPVVDAGDVQLAEALPPGGVDLIVGGHSHSRLNPRGLQPENIVNSVPIVQAGHRGQHLGKVELEIRGGRVKLKEACLLPVWALADDDDFHDTQIQPLLDRSSRLQGEPLGLIEPGLGLHSDRVCDQFSAGEEPLVNFVCDALYERLHHRGYPVDFVMLDASVLQCGLPEKEILTYGDFFSVMPFNDGLILFELTALQLAALLDDNARRIRLSGDSPVERGFLQFSRQIRYRIQPGDTRWDHAVQKVSWNGEPEARWRERTFTTGSTSFVRKLSIPWEAGRDIPLFDIAELPSLDTGLILRHEIVEYIKDQGGISRESGVRVDGRLEVLERSKDRE